ncbi:RNA-directed DNA polymerase, eukaryota [Tanacetum coccineum]
MCLKPTCVTDGLEDSSTCIIRTHEVRIAKKPEASQKRIRKEFQKEDALRQKEAFVKIREQAKASRENLQVVNIEVDNQIGLDRDLLDEVFLPKENVVTRWIKSIPIKINVFTWKLHLDRIPTRINLDRREVQVPSILCPVCNVAHEDTSRLFFSCVVATNIARLIYRWWNLTWIPVGSYSDWLAWFKTIRLGSKIKGILEGVFYVTWWSLWNFRNQLLFANQKPRKDVLFDEVVTRSFSWSLARSKNRFSWDSRLQHPYLIAL